jgi:hypothetical protein
MISTNIGYSKMNGKAVWLNILKTEFNQQGSARLGTINNNTMVYPRPVNQTPGNLPLGLKRYELSNHLGNVLSTISDLKLAVNSDSDDYTDSYEAIVRSKIKFSTS